MIGVLFIASCSRPKPLVYQDVREFSVRSANLTQPEVGMTLQFYNPNGYGMTLKDAIVKVYLNEQYIGEARLTQAFYAPRRDTFLLPVSLKADLTGFLSNALALAFNQEVAIRLLGTVKVGRGVFITIPIDYKGRQKLKLF